MESFVCSYIPQVLAVFDDIHVNKLLHILVFGESLLNGEDAPIHTCMCTCTYVQMLSQLYCSMF